MDVFHDRHPNPNIQGYNVEIDCIAGGVPLVIDVDTIVGATGSGIFVCMWRVLLCVCFI